MQHNGVGWVSSINRMLQGAWFGAVVSVWLYPLLDEVMHVMRLRSALYFVYLKENRHSTYLLQCNVTLHQRLTGSSHKLFEKVQDGSRRASFCLVG